MALVLFALFAVCILSVLMAGANVYQRTVRRDDSSYTQRTAAQYISTKVRQAGSPEEVSAEEFFHLPTLTLRQDLGGIDLLTRVYCYEGWLRELYYLDGSPLAPEDGEKILPLKELSVALEGGALQVVLVHEDGGRQQLTLSLRGGKEAAHEE